MITHLLNNYLQNVLQEERSDIVFESVLIELPTYTQATERMVKELTTVLKFVTMPNREPHKGKNVTLESMFSFLYRKAV